MNSSTHELFALASSLSKYIDDNEQFSLPLFGMKLARAQAQHPGDSTLGMLNRVVGKMSQGSKLSISRAEIKDLYEKFYSRNNKFAQLFEEELGVKEEMKEIVAPAPLPQTDLVQEAVNQMVDPVLASALDQVFGGNTVRPYSEKLAKHAVSVCTDRFGDLGIAVKAEVICGNSRLLVCAVSVPTPRGTTSVWVPVETDENQVTYSPSVFVGNEGSGTITRDAFVTYLRAHAGEKLTISPGEVFSAALQAQGGDEEISDVDLAVTKLRAASETGHDYLAPQIMGVSMESINPNLMVADLDLAGDDVKSIAAHFDSELGFAVSKFGSRLLERGKSLINEVLKEAGAGGAQIALTDSTDSSVVYSVALNGGTVAFTVPVRVAGEQILPPSILLCNGAIQSFDGATVKQLLRQGGFDRTAAVAASPFYGIKPSELVGVVRTALAEGNYAKAEDALNILAGGEDDKAYSTALHVFNSGLAGGVEKKEAGSQCSRVVNTKHSQLALCGHTGLPLHKVYQDKHGDCRPLYRQAMDDSYDAAVLINHKIFT